MSRQLFVNLAVENLDRSVEFFTKLGFTFNPLYTDETGTCMILGESNFVMLLTREKFASFIPHPVSDAKQSAEVMLALSCDSREEVDEQVRLAIEGGGTTYGEPRVYDFMYSHGYQDLDGHIWEVFYMDESKFPKS
jgi:Predicted lactoylglutathione lyase